MIIYEYEEQAFICPDDGPTPMKTDTPDDCSFDFADFIVKEYQLNEGKKVFDVGMGNGQILHWIHRLSKAEVYGCDIHNYLNHDNYIKGKTFPNMDIRDISPELYHSFDLAYYRCFSVPFKDTLEVLIAISKLLNHNGVFHLLLNDMYYNHNSSFVIQILREIHEELIIDNESYTRWTCIASKPRKHPLLTPMENYYSIIDDENYKQYINAGKAESELILSKGKQQQKIF